jgi:hypothetical protein
MPNMTGWHMSPPYRTHHTSISIFLLRGDRSSVTCGTLQCDGTQTPMNQTASKPNLAMASHSAEGTELKSTELAVFWLSSESQPQELISYKVGYWGQMDMIISSFGSSFAICYRRCAGEPVSYKDIPRAIILCRFGFRRGT